MAVGGPLSVVGKRHGISKQTIYTSRKHFGHLTAHDVKRLRQLEVKNARLKKDSRVNFRLSMTHLQLHQNT